MANTNALEGLKCPECGQDRMLRIAVSSMAEVTDDGTTLAGDTEWDEGSYCACPDCDFAGIVQDFRVDANPVITVTEVPSEAV
jgi:rubredoxin